MDLNNTHPSMTVFNFMGREIDPFRNQELEKNTYLNKVHFHLRKS